MSVRFGVWLRLHAHQSRKLVEYKLVTCTIYMPAAFVVIFAITAEAEGSVLITQNIITMAIAGIYIILWHLPGNSSVQTDLRPHRFQPDGSIMHTQKPQMEPFKVQYIGGVAAIELRPAPFLPICFNEFRKFCARHILCGISWCEHCSVRAANC